MVAVAVGVVVAVAVAVGVVVAVGVAVAVAVGVGVGVAMTTPDLEALYAELDKKAIVYKRFMVSPADGASGSMDRSTADRWVERTGYGTFVLELVRATEADLLRKLVAAMGVFTQARVVHDRTTAAKAALIEVCAAYDALLAVAPHWSAS